MLSTWSRSIGCPLLLLWLLAATPARAQVADIPDVRPGGEFEPFVIAVPPFDRVGDAALEQEELLSQVIANDLRLSGYFTNPENRAFAREYHLLDREKGEIQFAEWRRIKVTYLVKGTYELNPETDQLTVSVQLFDVIGGDYIDGQRYRYGVQDLRYLAHIVSNYIFERITGEPGVADTRIAYVRSVDRLGKHKQVCVMDADGWDPTAITPRGELVATPAWGLAGAEIYYTTYRDFNPDLRGVILSTGQSWWISRRAGFNISPAWSEKQQSIVLTMTRDGNSELYTISRDGKNLRRLTFSRAIDAAPSWSRDQTEICFTSDRTGRPQIYVLDVRTLDTRRLSYEGNYNDAAVWSPAGPEERIAYASRIDGKFHIFTIRPDGSGLRQLTSGNHNNEDPTWSPNGLMLAFTSDRSGTKQIYTMLFNGSNVTRLTSGADCKSPAWSPARQ